MIKIINKYNLKNEQICLSISSQEFASHSQLKRLQHVTYIHNENLCNLSMQSIKLSNLKVIQDEADKLDENQL